MGELAQVYAIHQQGKGQNERSTEAEVQDQDPEEAKSPVRGRSISEEAQRGSQTSHVPIHVTDSNPSPDSDLGSAEEDPAKDR